MWNPFVWHIEVPYTKRQLARMEAERLSQAVPTAVPAVPPVRIAVRVASATGVTFVSHRPPRTPPAQAGCPRCTANHVNTDTIAPPLPAPVNAVPPADVTGVAVAAPTAPSTRAGRQHTTTDHVNAQEPKVKYSRKVAAEEQQHEKSKRVHSAFKSTNTAHKVKHVTWAMDSAESSSTTSASGQTKKTSLRTPPSSASSASRRAVRVAAKALLNEHPNADDDDDLGTDSDDSSAIDTQEIPQSTVYRRGLQTNAPTYRPEESDLESDGAGSAIDDSEPPVRRHFTPKQATYTRQDKPRRNDHPQNAASQPQVRVNDWRLKTSPTSFNTNIIPPRPQSRKPNRFTQEDSDSDHGSAIDDRVPKHRRPTTAGNQPQPRQVTHSTQGLPNSNYGFPINDRVSQLQRSKTGGFQPKPRQVSFSTQGESDSDHGSAIDDRVPKHRRPTDTGPGPQSQHLTRSANSVSGRTQGSATDNHVPTSRRPQNDSIECTRSLSPLSAPLHSETAKEVMTRVPFEPPPRTFDNPLLDYHDSIARYRIRNAYRQGLMHAPPPPNPISPAVRPSNTVRKEADHRTEVRQDHRPYNPTKGTRNISPSGTRVQPMSAKKEADHMVQPTRRVVSEPHRQDGWHQPFRSLSPSPTREHSNNAKNGSNRQMERPRVASAPHSEYQERSEHRRLRSPSPPTTHAHSRKYRRSRSPSPSAARLDPIIVLKPKGKNPTLKNKRLVFVYRTKAQKDAMLAGENLHIKEAVRGGERPPALSRPAELDSTPKFKMSGGLGFLDKKQPKALSKGKESKYRSPTVESDSDDTLVRRNGVGVTWRDV